MAVRRILTLWLLAMLVGCGTVKSGTLAGGPAGPATPATAPVETAPSASDTTWPVALPTDGVQPWEQTDAAGHVVPAARGASGVNGQSLFSAGVETFLTGGTTAVMGEATRLTSSIVGSHALSYAIYRLPASGGEPGVISLDVNLADAGSSYYAGVADYSTNHWQWHGPYQDNHIRLTRSPGQLDSAGYVSPTGNLFVCVVAYDGSSVDVVGVGANPLSDGDAALPPAPAALAATPEHGGLLLEWTPSAAGDLAGYRVLWSSSRFAAASDIGVQSRNFSDGGGRLFLPLPFHYTFVAVQAIDIAGNAGPLSPVVDAVPLPGQPPALGVKASAVSGLHDTAITLTASGAQSYDFDVDGDGIYDITGNTTGHANVDTTKPGIIRPGVRGHGADGQAVALGGVSLIITGNTRPAVSASATPQDGTAPLLVNFSATAQDAEDAPATLTYAWDFDGNGIYEPGTNQASLQYTYTIAGTYNAKVRVTDSQGAWSVDTLAIAVSPEDIAPTARFTVMPQQQVLPLKLQFLFDGSTSHDDGPIATYAWDALGTGTFSPPSASPSFAFSYPQVGTYSAQLKVTDYAGQTDMYARPVYVPSVWSSTGGQPGTTNRQSPIVGAQTNHIRWRLQLPSTLYGSPVLGADGTVYVCCANGTAYALRDNGTVTPSVKWSFATGAAIDSTPAIGADGTVYVTSEDSKVYALVDNGTATPSVKWSYTGNSSFFGGAALGADGTVYVATNIGRTVYALRDNGTTTPTAIWSYLVGGDIYDTPVVGPDGTVYIGSYDDHKLWALVNNGSGTPTVKWSFASGGGVQTSPAIGPDGTVYAGSWDSKLYALVDNGTATPTVKWSFSTGGEVRSSPALGPDGTVYFGSDDGMFYAVQDNGTATAGLRWSYSGGSIVALSSVVLGADGTVYCGGFSGTLRALVDNGTTTPTLKWSYASGFPFYGSVAIGPDGLTYAAGEDSYIYCFGP